MHSAFSPTDTVKVFSGPISESVPSSVTGFAHRRSRTDSIASFTYFQEHDDSPEWSDDQAIVDDLQEATSSSEHLLNGVELDLEAGSLSPRRRKSSGLSRASAGNALLYRSDSTQTDGSTHDRNSRMSQKIYVLTEDLTVVVAGFNTRPVGFIIYLILCIFSAGLGYLVLRWLPRWRVLLIGVPKPLSECKWVVTEVSLVLPANSISRS